MTYDDSEGATLTEDNTAVKTSCGTDDFITMSVEQHKLTQELMNDCNSWYIDYPNSATTNGDDLTYSVLNCVGLRDFETPRSTINISPGVKLDFRVGFNLYKT